MKNALLCLIIIIVAFGCKKRDVPHYIVSRVVKSDTASKLIVNIGTRLSQTDLLGIAAKIKGDSSALSNLQLCYMLPGHNDKNTGPDNFYAIAKYPNASVTTMQDTLKDVDGNVVRLNIKGLSAQDAKHLLELAPKEIQGKNILGKFIDDSNHTLIVPFTEVNDPKKEVYIIEFDHAGKVVSATVPMRDNKDGIEKLIVTHRGDYCTLKDSILTQYSIDDLGLPYNSIKSGI
ncbi:hypothetical protein SAMN05421821_109146 [Mucilaginibacter lappiensis]|uniref:Lipoprotein n=1 Tax=Mucilaginibacter lappiensis TaxID=354630 RepID=A0ABR6PM47_9SPHI|nr:hypothetical protein [Mucilaginibacter lappiensis]MBB6110839.1 hypothetical protein [Mucilaginibacter lappiensis]SIR62423.1 hypothetical protein SAMN05421821_109146 [Mucilaginibacter lappiensis]